MPRSPLIMSLLVRDEADIIAHNIEYHLAHGVDHLIATDNASVDGTREILEDYEKSGVLTLLDEPSDAYLQDVWATRMARMAAERFGPCWLISNDADEFWHAPNGNLKRSLARHRSKMVRCERRNMITAHEWLGLGNWHEALIFSSVNPPRPPRLNDPMSDPLGQPFFYYALMPKLILRSEGLKRIAHGVHEAEYDGEATCEDSDITVYHYPVRSSHEFSRSIERIGRAVLARRGVALNISWKYRRWHAMTKRHADTGPALREALPGAQQLNADLANGRIMRDRRLVTELSSIDQHIGGYG